MVPNAAEVGECLVDIIQSNVSGNQNVKIGTLDLHVTLDLVLIHAIWLVPRIDITWTSCGMAEREFFHPPIRLPRMLRPCRMKGSANTWTLEKD